jgi:hypothetical protein
VSAVPRLRSLHHLVKRTRYSHIRLVQALKNLSFRVLRQRKILVQRAAVSREAASYMVGDLAEQNASTWMYVRVVTRMLFAASWRYILGAFVGLLVAFAALSLFMSMLNYRLVFSGARHVDTSTWLSWAGGLIAAGISLAMIAALSICRFGPCHRQSISAVVWALVMTSAACTVWMPHSGIWMTAALSGFAALMLPSTRRPSLNGLASATAFAGLFAGLVALLLWADVYSTIPPILSPSGGAWMIAITFAAWVLARPQPSPAATQTN